MGGFFWHLYGNYEAVGEDGFVKEFTRKGFYSVPSDHARNISVYFGLPLRLQKPSKTKRANSKGISAQHAFGVFCNVRRRQCRI